MILPFITYESYPPTVKIEFYIQLYPVKYRENIFFSIKFYYYKISKNEVYSSLPNFLPKPKIPSLFKYYKS